MTCPWNYKDDGVCGRLKSSFWCEQHEEVAKKVWEPPVMKEKKEQKK